MEERLERPDLLARQVVGERGPQTGCSLLICTMRASTSAGIWCGQLAGREDESARAPMPPEAYQRSQRCTVWRVTP